MRRPLCGIAASLLLIALAAGALAQLLFFGELPGINFPIWVALVLSAAVTLRPAEVRMARIDLWIPVAALVSAGH